MDTKWIVLGLALWLAVAMQAAEPERDWQALELVGKAFDHWDKREWSSYCWREDFSLLVDNEGSRMGTTYTGLKVDWSKNAMGDVLPAPSSLVLGRLSSRPVPTTTS